MDNLNEVFDIVVNEQPNQSKEVVVVSPPKKIIQDPVNDTLIPDFITAKDNIDTIMEMGRTALEKVLTIAEAGQHPRFYEAAAILIKNLSDANKDYLDVHEKVSRIRKNYMENGNESPGNAKINIEQAVFTGTATELLQQVNPRKITLESTDVK